MVELQPGDVVVFKKDTQHQEYRDRNHIQEPIVVRRVDSKYVYWNYNERARSCYLRRVELQEGPLVMALEKGDLVVFNEGLYFHLGQPKGVHKIYEVYPDGRTSVEGLKPLWKPDAWLRAEGPW